MPNQTTTRQRTRTAICVHCGEHMDEHCHFEPLYRWDGCSCDHREWGDPNSMRAPCDKFTGKPGKNCSVCEHDEVCHTQQTTQTP